VAGFQHLQVKPELNRGIFSLEAIKERSKLKWSDPELEQKLFPWLYPYGTGGWHYITAKQGSSLGRYLKMRIFSADKRWAWDKYWPFFAFDWKIKTQIHGFKVPYHIH